MKSTTIELVGYSEEFKRVSKTGWGCGYVLIDLKHPFLVKELLNSDTNFYPQVENFSEEITFCEISNDVLKIGFDTAHRYNNINIHNEKWVEQKANELKMCIEDYTILDSKLEVQKYFIDLRTKFKDYI